MKKLTIDDLKEMKRGVFATGITNDDRLVADKELKWVAVRGTIHDWAIYYHLSSMPDSFVASNGDKCFTTEVIRELVPCTDAAFEMYRY